MTLPPTDPTRYPLRLRDDPLASTTVRADLNAATRPTLVYDANAGIDRFRSTLESGDAASHLSSAAPSGFLGPIAKNATWLMAAVALVSAAGLLNLLNAQHPVAAGGPGPRATPTSKALQAHQDARSPTTHVQIFAPETRASERTTMPRSMQPRTPAAGQTATNREAGRPSHHGKAKRSARRKSTHSDAGPAQAEATTKGRDRLAREIDQLAATRRHLANDPAKSLALTIAGASEFPDGNYVEEREGYAILALFALSHGAEAQVRAKKHLARYPSGTLSGRIERAALKQR